MIARLLLLLGLLLTFESSAFALIAYQSTPAEIIRSSGIVQVGFILGPLFIFAFEFFRVAKGGYQFSGWSVLKRIILKLLILLGIIIALLFFILQ